MSVLFNCAIFCMLLSFWGVVQLFLMGIFYNLEATVLIEDVEEHIYDNYDDFITKTKRNYQATAINCWIAAVMYAIMIGLSYLCLLKARKNDEKTKAIEKDDDYICSHPSKPK